MLRTIESDGGIDVAIVSGLSQGFAYPIATAKQAIENSLTAWYLTEAGRVGWFASVEDFNVGDLAVVEAGLGELLKVNGIRNLKIDTTIGCDLWQYDDRLGTPPPTPPETPIGSLRIYWVSARSGELFYHPVDSLLVAAAQLEMLNQYDNFVLDGYHSNGGVQRLVALKVNGQDGSGWHDCTDEIAPF